MLAPSSKQKRVGRAIIILHRSVGLGTSASMPEAGEPNTSVWRWQERLRHLGVDGFRRDKIRPSGRAPIPPKHVAEIVRLSQDPPPHEATHRTARAMAKFGGLAVSTVQSIWKAHCFALHRWHSFKLANDLALAEKLHNIVGLYVSPPAHAVELSFDETSQIQAFDRTQPGLPMTEGCAVTMSHDFKPHGATALFPALNVLDGTVIAQNMRRPQHPEFIRFLNRIERAGAQG